MVCPKQPSQKENYEARRIPRRYWNHHLSLTGLHERKLCGCARWQRIQKWPIRTYVVGVFLPPPSPHFLSGQLIQNYWGKYFLVLLKLIQLYFTIIWPNFTWRDHQRIILMNADTEYRLPIFHQSFAFRWAICGLFVQGFPCKNIVMRDTSSINRFTGHLHLHARTEVIIDLFSL